MKKTWKSGSKGKTPDSVKRTSRMGANNPMSKKKKAGRAAGKLMGGLFAK